MKNFVKGSLFILLIIPLIEGLVNLFQTLIEFLSVRIAAKTYKIQKTLQEEENQEQESTYAIGFRMPDSEDYYDDDDEEYDD